MTDQGSTENGARTDRDADGSISQLADGQLIECLGALTRAVTELAAGEHRPRPSECLLTAEELADRLRLSARTLKDQAASGVIPHHRFGKHYRFSADDIAEILRLTKQEPRRSRRARAVHVA
jgi:excisionase family DNA binding protein